jgi:hypothetical protein
VRWAGRQAIVSFPGHVDISNAGQLRDRLLAGLDDVIQEIRDYAFASGDPAPLGTG